MSRAWVSEVHSAKMHFGVWILQPTPYITEKSVNFGAIWANISTLNKHLLQMIIGTGKAWKSNYIHYKVWDELFIRSKLQRLHRWSLGMGKQFHLNTLLGMRLIIHTGIRINPCYVFFVVDEVPHENSTIWALGISTITAILEQKLYLLRQFRAEVVNVNTGLIIVFGD